MYLKLLITGLSLLALSCGTLAVKRENNKNHPFMWPEAIYDLDDHGSGDRAINSNTDDEDLIDGSGDQMSGSGDTTMEPETTTLKPTVALTDCQYKRMASMNSSKETYKPQCTDDGQYEKTQCRLIKRRKECWCVDPVNTEITGSRMTKPMEPDCVHGKNLKPCVYQLLRKRHGLLGIYEPHCTFDGEYEKIQCHGAACWCVDAEGLEQLGTKVYKPAVPKCKEPTTPAPITRKPVPVTEAPTPEPTYRNFFETEKPTRPKDKKKDHKKDKTDVVIPDIKIEPDVGDDNKDDNTDLIGTPEKQNLSPLAHVMAKPGLLAAVIGGAVVGLLCAVLLVMFIVYRMRKKDEGSYPLDEQKFTNYSYMKANDKEFYA